MLWKWWCLLPNNLTDSLLHQTTWCSKINHWVPLTILSIVLRQLLMLHFWVLTKLSSSFKRVSTSSSSNNCTTVLSSLRTLSRIKWLSLLLRMQVLPLAQVSIKRKVSHTWQLRVAGRARLRLSCSSLASDLLPKGPPPNYMVNSTTFHILASLQRVLTFFKDIWWWARQVQQGHL